MDKSIDYIEIQIIYEEFYPNEKSSVDTICYILRILSILGNISLFLTSLRDGNTYKE